MEIIILPKGKDKKHHKILRQATEFYVKKLMGKKDIRKIKTINIRLLDSIAYGTLQGDCRETVGTDGTFDIFFRLRSSDPLPEMLSTLAHETVHAKQAVKGELTIEADIWNWKGKKMVYKDAWYSDFTSEQQYDRLPWEKEAYDLEKSLACSYFVNYFNSNY